MTPTRRHRQMMAISIAPVGQGAHVGRYVAAALKALEGLDLQVEVGPMFTTLVGPWSVLAEAVERMQNRLFAMGVERVSVVIKVDAWRDRDADPNAKVQRVQQYLEEKG